MEMNSQLKLWSLRYSVGMGWKWVIERGVKEDTSKDWLRLFSSDEPEIEFKLSMGKPKIPIDKS